MDKRPPRPMTPFDELVTLPQLQLIKLLLPYTPEPGQRLLAAFIKLLEFRRTIRLFSRSNIEKGPGWPHRDGASSREVIDSIKPYLDPVEAENLDMFLNMKDIMDMAEMMQGSSGGSLSSDPMDLIMGMLSPEQQEMFSAYSDMFSQTADNDRKGDDNNERMDEQPRTERYRSGEAGADPDGGREDERKNGT